MSDKLSTFPRNSIEALTILYLQNQDLSNLTPAELRSKYEEVYREIKEAKAKAKGKPQKLHY